MSYRVLIADDEPLARRGVRAKLRPYPAFSIERECATGDDALAGIREIRPDVAFLDVQMPGMSGLEVARSIDPTSLPAVIFTTAYDQYALEAFEAHGVDYLLKPLDDARFARALEKARRLIDSGPAQKTSVEETRHDPFGRHANVERFWVRTRGKVILVPVLDVDWIGAEGDYVRLHVRDRSYLINDSLTALESRIAWAQFARIHRSTIVNLARVRELRPHLNQDHTVQLTTGVELRLSRTYYRRFIGLMRRSS